MSYTDEIIKPTTDLFIASLWSAPKNEPILLSLLNGVMTDISEVVSTVLLAELPELGNGSVLL